METLMTMEIWRSYTHLNCKLILPFKDLSRARWSHRHILCIYFSFLTPLNITVSPPLPDLVFSTDSSHFVPSIINGMKSFHQRKPCSVLFDTLQSFCLEVKQKILLCSLSPQHLIRDHFIYFTETSVRPLNPSHFVVWNFCTSWTYSSVASDKSRSYSPEMSCLVQRAISVSSVYFSIALNSVIMRQRWLHYQRRVIGPFHQLLATHCANHGSVSLPINRCDLVIKQGDGGNMLMLLVYFLSI